MGIFHVLSSGDVSRKKERHLRLRSFRPVVTKWENIEKNLSPEEKRIKRLFFLRANLLALFLFVSVALFPSLQRLTIGFWPQAEADFFYSDTLFLAEEGFLGKASVPSVSGVDRSRVGEIIEYTVEAGDTLSSVAEKFGLTVASIVENNQIEEHNMLKSGIVLFLPPVDGVLYKVKSGDTLTKIANKYGISIEEIQIQNSLSENDPIVKGRLIVLPGARKPADIILPPPEKPVIVADIPKTPSRGQVVKNPTTPVISVKPSKTPLAKASGKGKLVFPTKGKISQGYHYGHYAIDIADQSKPAILAAMGGTVVKASSGCKSRQTGCNHGYGNYIVIDHGNGMTTLYGHNEVLYVSVGDTVAAGQAIAKMGNTGTVYGATGIHLHFEVVVDGSKKNPMNYF